MYTQKELKWEILCDICFITIKKIEAERSKIPDQGDQICQCQDNNPFQLWVGQAGLGQLKSLARSLSP